MNQLNDNSQAPGEDLLSLIEGLGGVLASFEELTRLKRSDSPRASFRLNLADGRIFKGRQFDTKDQRTSVTSLLSKLEGLPFNSVIATRGIATIEEWIVGSPLVMRDVRNEFIVTSANVLGRLHSIQDYPRETPFIPEPETVSLDRIKHELDDLHRQGLLRGDTVLPLFYIAEDNKPAELKFGFIHTDFHPENMIVTADGTLYIIDNEHIKIGALDFDLARSWSRWPMNDSQREIFRMTYEENRRLDEFFTHEKFWAVLSLTRTAYIHARHRKANQMALDQLHLISGSKGKITWPTLGS